MTANIRLHVLPKTEPVKWRTFLTKKYPVRSIALDGFVIGPTKYELNEKKFNFNHHEGVDRLSTRSTCGQLGISLRLGLDDQLRNEKGELDFDIYVNDCDQDVCLSVFLLRNSYLTKNAINPKLNRLIHCEDALDTTSGAYPFPKDLPFLGELAWIYEPYTNARKNGLLGKKDEALFLAIIEDVCLRISQYIAGTGKSISHDTTYEIIGGGSKWKMVREHGDCARTGMFSDGIYAFASVRNRQEEGVWDYVIGRQSPFIQFNMEGVFKALNEREGNATDKWGCSDTVGGSPRVAGSRIPPEEVERIINEIEKTA